MLNAASGRKLDDDDTFLCGKPCAGVLWHAIAASERAHQPDLQPQQMLMVGDSMKTDIAFGAACGVRTMLVLSGNTESVEQARAVAPDIAPDFVAPSLAVGAHGTPHSSSS